MSPTCSPLSHPGGANSLLNNKILKKVIAADKITMNEKSKLVSVRVENIVEKGENADYQHFLLFPPCF